MLDKGNTWPQPLREENEERWSLHDPMITYLAWWSLGGILQTVVKGEQAQTADRHWNSELFRGVEFIGQYAKRRELNRKKSLHRRFSGFWPNTELGISRVRPQAGQQKMTREERQTWGPINEPNNEWRSQRLRSNWYPTSQNEETSLNPQGVW